MRRFTSEQPAAIEALTGSSLLAAIAGSGKTAVMVERIAARCSGVQVRLMRGRSPGARSHLDSRNGPDRA